MASVRSSTLDDVTCFYKSYTSYSRLLYCFLLLLCVFHCSRAAPRAEASMRSPRSKLLETSSDSNIIASTNSRNHDRLLSVFEDERKSHKDKDENNSNKDSNRAKGATMGLAQAQEVRDIQNNQGHAATNTESRAKASEKESDIHQMKRKYRQGYRSRVQIDYKTVYDRQRLLEGMRLSGKAGKSLEKGFESTLTLEEAKWYPDYIFIFPSESEDTAGQERDGSMEDREQQEQGQPYAHGGDQQQPSSQPPPESTTNSSDSSDAGRSKVVHHNYYFRDYYWDPDSYPHEKAVDYRIEIPVVWQAEPETSPTTTTTTNTITTTTSTTIANQTTTTPQPVTSTLPGAAPSSFALNSFLYTHLAILAAFSAAFALVEV